MPEKSKSKRTAPSKDRAPTGAKTDSKGKKEPLASQASVAQKALLKLGLRRDIDLALHLPLRYEDETHIVKLADSSRGLTRDGDTIQIEARVVASEVVLRPRRQLVVTVNDGTDSCVLRFFHFYPSTQKALAVDALVRVRGEVRGGFLGLQMMHPTVRTAGGPLPDSLTPVYPTSASLPQPFLRRAILSGLKRADLSECIPANLPDGPALSLRAALEFLHHPPPDVSVMQLEDRTHPAWQRLKMEELLAHQISQLQSRRERDRLRAPSLIRLNDGVHSKLMQVLPFALTNAQQRVCSEIEHDIGRGVPMHRLLQGDVGSGKTVVAALSAAVCIDAGWQCALMAPTEILAAQHFSKLVGWLEPLGVRVAWLTGSQKKKERMEMLELVASGEAGLVIGTHAVIQEQVQFKRLALAIIDEQHRFGVAQRLALRSKMTDESLEPHTLMMTATPIPRTLAMSYYADLDVSTIDELPPGRTPIVTKVVTDSRRDEVIERIRAQLAQGSQVYWVCPLIEESEALDLANATHTHAELTELLQPNNGEPPVMVGLLHSRMTPAEKKAVMAMFTDGSMAVLVSTTVIEVGVDVPNASLMVIEHSERFGLSQLHQLRGRVGRGRAASACVLLYTAPDSGRLGETARARLKAMVETADGFEIARRDLEIRGPGEFLGSRQSGAPLLRFADMQTDIEWLEWARLHAAGVLDQTPELANRLVARWLGDKAQYIKA